MKGEERQKLISAAVYSFYCAVVFNKKLEDIFCIWKVISNKSSQPSQRAFKAFVVYVDKLPEHIKNV